MKGSGAMTMADLRPSDKATAPRQQSERDRLAAIRQARRDLLRVPAMPVKPVTISELGAYRKCAGCDRRVHGQAFTDAHGWLWCERCATSDVIGAAFTSDECGALTDKLFSAADACARHQVSPDMLAELRALRDEMPAVWYPGKPPVPNPYGLAF